MKNILKTIRLSVYSRLNYNKNLTSLQRKRLKVCKKCPFNSDNASRQTIKSRFMIFLNKALDYILGVRNRSNAICTDCGCNLIHKSAQKNKEDMCGLGKWDILK
jgi:chloramphenicol 3-O-phosphotransferase